MNTFVVTNANDCPNILSHGAIFRMGILVPNYPEENVVKLGDQETGTSNVFQILQDLWIKQYQGKSESKAHQPSTTLMTGTIKQPKVWKTHKTASQKAGMATYIANMSQIPTPCRTMPPPKTRTKANTSHSTRRPASGTHQFYSHLPPTCCMHVHQQQSQTYRPGEPLALREVKHPHKGRTSVSRSPSIEQEVLSHFSGYSEEIGHFTRDPYKPHLKSCLQSTKHASKKQEVNTHTDWVHSYRMEHAEHFPAPMEMCMDDHHTQTTERTQWQHLQDFTFSHAEFPPGMENTPSFPGKQFLQGKEEFTLPDMENTPALLRNQSMQENEKNMDTGTFTSESTTLNRHSMLSTLTHPRRVPQNFQQLEMESSNTVALPYFNHNAETTTHMEAPKNVHDKETLSTNLKMDTNMDTNHMAHRYRHTEKEAHLLSEPSELQPLKAMAHRYTEKEAHLLSGPSELQPPDDSETQKIRSSTQVRQPRQEYSRFTETEKAKFQTPFIYNDDRNFVQHNSVEKFSPYVVYLTKPDTSSDSIF